MDSGISGHKCLLLIRNIEILQNEITQLKQVHSSEKIQLKQMNQELMNILKAREADYTELYNKTKAQERVLDQFRQLHNRMAIGGGGNQS